MALREILKGGKHNFHSFFKRIFFFREKKFEADWESKKALYGSGACYLGKISKIYLLQWLFGYFSAFTITFRQILFYFLTLIWLLRLLRCISFAYFQLCMLKAEGVKAYCYQRDSKLWKNCILYIKNIFENGWILKYLKKGGVIRAYFRWCVELMHIYGCVT